MTDIRYLQKLLNGLIKKPLRKTLRPALEGVCKKIDDNVEECLVRLSSEHEELDRA